MARHIDVSPEAKVYYDKKRAEGKKHNQSLRSLARHMVRVIWGMLRDERDYEIRKEKSSEIIVIEKNQEASTIEPEDESKDKILKKELVAV